jgi:hypothetical protein
MAIRASSHWFTKPSTKIKREKETKAALSNPRDASKAGSTDVAQPLHSQKCSKRKQRKSFNKKYVRSDEDVKP